MLLIELIKSQNGALWHAGKKILIAAIVGSYRSKINKEARQAACLLFLHVRGIVRWASPLYQFDALDMPYRSIDVVKLHGVLNISLCAGHGKTSCLCNKGNLEPFWGIKLLEVGESCEGVEANNSSGVVVRLVDRGKLRPR